MVIFHSFFLFHSQYLSLHSKLLIIKKCISLKGYIQDDLFNQYDLLGAWK